MKVSRLRRLDRLEGRARAEARVGGVVRVPDAIGYPPPPEWAPPGGWPRGAFILVPEVLTPEAWSARYGKNSDGRDGHEE